jgi:nucleotide-binding universal stress UspA family protein
MLDLRGRSIMTTQSGQPTNRIVVGVDGSDESKQALRWAAEQARYTGSTLDVVTAWQVPIGFGWPAILPEDYDPAADARQVLDAAIDEVLGKDPDLEIQRIVEEGQAAAALLERSKGARELVVGSRGRGGFAGMLLGSTSNQCVQHASCPVVVIRHHD